MVKRLLLACALLLPSCGGNVDPCTIPGYPGCDPTPTPTPSPTPPPANRPPVAELSGAPLSGVAPLTVSFDASASSDPDGDPLAFAWAFGDGEQATGASPVHTYATAGSFTVTLTVSDGRGGGADASAGIQVAPPPEPVACVAPRINAATCCDCPDGRPGCPPGVDEGFARGWTVPSEETIERYARESQGCVNGLVFRTGPYVAGDTEYPIYGPGGEPPDWALLRAAVRDANAHGMRGVVDIGDGWALRHRLNPGGLSCAATGSSPPPLWLEHARQVAGALCDLDVEFETGNELWLCDPSRAWEQGIVDAIRAACPGAVVGSNARTGVSGIDYFASHGWPPSFEPGIKAPAAWTESDNQEHGPFAVETMTKRNLKPHTVTGWISAIQETSAAGIVPTFWPGVAPEAEVDATLRGMVEAEPTPTPTPGPGPTCGPITEWSCSPSPSEESDAVGAEVERAIRAVMDTQPFYLGDYRTGPDGHPLATVHRDNRLLFTGALATHLREVEGLCAWAGDPSGSSHDEVIVQTREPGEPPQLGRAVVWDAAQCNDPLYCVGPFVRIQPFDCTR